MAEEFLLPVSQELLKTEIASHDAAIIVHQGDSQESVFEDGAKAGLAGLQSFDIILLDSRAHSYSAPPTKGSLVHSSQF